MDKEVAAFSVKECDEVFSRWESGPLKNHTLSLGDVVLYLVLNESSYGERASLPMAVNSIA